MIVLTGNGIDMRRLFFVLVNMLLAGYFTGGVAADTVFFDTPQIQFKRFANAPDVDGVLDDPCWQSAELIPAFHNYMTSEKASIQTEVLGCVDKENLYIGFRCQEPKTIELSSATIEHNSLRIFSVDHIEVFLKSAPASDVYYHFAVSTTGATYASHTTDAKWSAEWQAAVKVSQNYWTVEIKIPLKTIKADATRFIRANFCRERRLSPQETTCWSTTFGRFHNPSRFGAIFLGDVPLLQLDQCRMVAQADKSYQLSAKVQSLTSSTTGVVANLMLMKNGTYVDAGRNTFQLNPNQTVESMFSLKPETAYTGPVVLTVRDSSGSLLYSRGPQDISLTGTCGMKIVRVLPDEASQGIRWLESERLRGCCYGFKVNPLPGLAMIPLNTASPECGAAARISLRGETIVRVLAGKKEPLSFELTSETASSPFSKSTYAVFAPDGTFLAEGDVTAGETKNVSLPVTNEGLYVLWINSGPASDNAFMLRLDNRHWVFDGRGKGAYANTKLSVNSARDLSLAGFNTILLTAWNWGVDFSTDEGLAEWIRLIKPWAEAAERYHIRLIPYVGWGCAKTDVTAAGDYRKAISLREIDGPRPCPLSEEYWERSFMRRALAVARLSQKNRYVVGIGLDPESYYFGSWYGNEYKKRGLNTPGATTIFNDDECFCDHCFHGFLTARGLSKPKVAATGKARLEWLKGEKLSDAYYKYLEDELSRLTRGMITRLHEVNPDFTVVVMLLGLGDFWWCRGASRGFGSSRVPVIEFGEETYVTGFTRQTETHTARFKQWGANVLHGGGLWAGQHRPDRPEFLSAQLYHFGVCDGGYWIWPGDPLWRNPDRTRHFQVLAGYQEDYWKSFVFANQELDRKLREGDADRSTLEMLVTPPPVGRNLDRVTGPNEWSLKPFYPLRVGSGAMLAFYVPKGTARLTLKWGSRSKDGLWIIRVAAPKRSITFQSYVTGDAPAEQAVFDVSTDEVDNAWTIKVESANKEGHIGIGIEGVSPFFSISPSTLVITDPTTMTKQQK